MTENRKAHVIVLRAAAVLLILVMLSTSMVAGRYARYTSSASGNDSARVAKFRVTESGDLKTTFIVKISPGKSVDKIITVANDSEVAVEYEIIARNEHNNLPLQFQLMDGGTPVDAAKLAPGKTKDLTFRIIWEAGYTSDSYIGMVDAIQLTITATQID